MRAPNPNLPVNKTSVASRSSCNLRRTWQNGRIALSRLSVAVVNFQVSILKVLASYPLGMASLTQLKRDLDILVTSGPDWARWIRTIAAEAGGLDIFGAGFVERYTFGWRLTRKGLDALEAMEARARLGAGTDQLPGETAADPPMSRAVAAKSGADETERSFERSLLAEPNALERRLQWRVIQGGRSREPSSLQTAIAVTPVFIQPAR